MLDRLQTVELLESKHIKGWGGGGGGGGGERCLLGQDKTSKISA